MSGFDPDTLDILNAARTVRIETSAGEGRPVHSTIIWVVVDDTDRVLVRSVRGPRGRWYRELLHNPGVLVADRQRIPVRGESAHDPDRIEACSAALRAKYRPGASLDSMLRDEVLGTTLQLHAI